MATNPPPKVKAAPRVAVAPMAMAGSAPQHVAAASLVFPPIEAAVPAAPPERPPQPPRVATPVQPGAAFEVRAPVLPTPLAAQYAAASAVNPPAAAQGPQTSASVSDAQRAAIKVARRGAVRRARLAGAAPSDSTAPAPEVLVLDADADARRQLCTLLQSFGFNVRTATDPAEGGVLACDRAFAAIFADVALDAADGGAGIELCRQVRELNGLRPGAATLLVLVAPQLRPLDRVRADLAGFDEALAKPATRGSVARVLDERGIALPADPRRV
jgi:CheY-like chemotaxis protein